MKILVIEDDEAFSALVQAALEEQHYQVDRVTDARSGWDWLDAYEYDLILLDLILPGEADGLCFCRELRAKGNLTPVLLMTANEAQSVKVKGLDAGADDYLVKPFDWEELLARVRALFRRGQDSLSPLLTWGSLELDPSSCEVCRLEPALPSEEMSSGAVAVKTEPTRHALALTAKEYSLLELLLRNPQRIFSASSLLDRLWDCDDAPSENAVRAHIKGLRRKLKQAQVGNPIETAYGLGYRLREEPPRPESMAREADRAVSESSAGRRDSMPGAAADALTVSREPFQQQLERVWQRARKTYLDQVVALDGMVEQRPQQLGPEDWTLMRRQAHSLKGGLGSFGLHGAAAVAAQLQELVEPGLAMDDDALGQEVRAPSMPPLGELHRLLNQLRQVLETALTLQLDPVVPAPPEPLGQCWLATADAALAERLVAAAAEVGVVLDRLAPDDSLERCLLPREDGLSEGGGALPQVVLWDCETAPEIGGEHLQGRSWSALTEGDSLVQRLNAAQWDSGYCLDRQTASADILAVVSAQLQGLQRKRLGAAKILVVDDDLAFLALLETLLQPWGIQLTLLHQPEQFWSVLQQVQPDMLILDVEMPEINGLDLCRVVRQDPQWCELPILFLSARHDAPLLEQLFEVGANDFLRKPVTGERLLERVRNGLGRLLQESVGLEVQGNAGVEAQQDSVETSVVLDKGCE